MRDARSNRVLRALREAEARPLVIAHRGASSIAPENTLLAARLGHEVGADAWEFDVQTTRDGVPVVIHDESLIRTTDVALRYPDDPRAHHGYQVSDFDLAEIRTLDAGARFLGPQPHETLRIPTLRECLELTRDLDWLANAELKTHPNNDERTLPACVREIQRAGVADRILVSSFSPGDVVGLDAIDLPIATGILVDGPLLNPAYYAREIIGADCYHTSTLALGAGSDRFRRDPRAENLAWSTVQALRASGVPVLVYTVNDAGCGGPFEAFARLGVSGIFTDTPGPIRERIAATASEAQSTSRKAHQTPQA